MSSTHTSRNRRAVHLHPPVQTPCMKMKLPLSISTPSRSALVLGSVLIGLLPSPLWGQGSIVAWGAEHLDQVALIPGGTEFTQVAGGGYHALALRADGSILSWGWDNLGQLSYTPGGTGFTQVVTGGTHSLALRTSGSIVSWGGDFHGQVSSAPGGTRFTQVATGDWHSLALRVNGSIVSWGADSAGQVSALLHL